MKLLGHTMRTDGGCCAFVAPHLVPLDHLLASVSGVMNAVVVRASAVGEVMFYGPGAGKRPTASAVAADIIDALQHRAHRKDTSLGLAGGTLAPEARFVSQWYVRAAAAPDAILPVFPGVVTMYGASQECGFITGPMDRPTIEEKAARIGASAMYRVLT